MIFLHPAIYIFRYLQKALRCVAKKTRHSPPEAWGRLDDEAAMARI